MTDADRGGLAAGIDIGGTTVKWMVVGAGGELLTEGREASGTDTVAQVCSLASHLVEEYPRISGCGVVSAGVVDERHGRVVYASNLHLAGAELAQAVSRASQRPTLLGHDGRAAGLAEGIMGAGRGVSSFLMVPIGTGISAALCLPGGVWAGETFGAGEIGHIPVFPDGEQCPCGQRGCLEVYASAHGIAQRYKRLTGCDVGARGVEEHLGEAEADQVWKTAVRALALGLTHMTLTLDPGRIVIGGGLSKAGDTLLEPVRAEVASLLVWREPPEIVRAQLGGSAGRWGAAILGSMAGGSHDHEGWRA